MDSQQSLNESSLNSNVKRFTVRGKGKKPIDPNKQKASWDNHNHEVFVMICLEEMQQGNKPGQTLNRMGYMNLARNFFEQTHVRYERDQFKNHWDVTRKDWQTWKALQKRNRAGLG
ncbi:hypothetical protein QJS04_geneDACA014713 [Acorus gramineus]|uniref:Myb/SANT-like domain-containing protein n=1 Tax=Acorus gramineus TaxID=55184 RepID=A0AAV9B2P8_ACOGR|nr:hypothetical protein QJS04_geneDACA014713 [Acorus gramineus]